MAPPRKYKKMPTKTFSYRVGLEIWNKVEKIAAEQEKTITELFDEFVERLIRDNILYKGMKNEESPRQHQNIKPHEIDAEIAALEAEYGTMPNAETITAMREADAGNVEKVSMGELKAMLDEIC